MIYQYSHRLGQKPGGLDPDAKAYIDAVVAAGATVSGTQKKAISEFVKTGKSDGWYTSIKRLYLPIWAAASPNAIDIISRASGTFVGTPTYSASTVSFASGAFFDSGTSFQGQGLTDSSGCMFLLVTSWTGTGYVAGSGSAGNNTLFGRVDSSNLRLRYSGNIEGSGQLSATGNAGTLGIISASRQGGDRKIYLRSNTGRSLVATLTSGNFGTPQSSNVIFSGYNNSDSTLVPITVGSTLGLWGFGLGLTDAQDNSFTSALETLWETCTGLTLP